MPAYAIAEPETVTVTLPASMLASEQSITASPAFVIEVAGATGTLIAGSLAAGLAEADLAGGGLQNLTISLVGDTWLNSRPSIGLLDGLVSGQAGREHRGGRRLCIHRSLLTTSPSSRTRRWRSTFVARRATTSARPRPSPSRSRAPPPPRARCRRRRHRLHRLHVHHWRGAGRGASRRRPEQGSLRHLADRHDPLPRPARQLVLRPDRRR